MNKFKKSLSLVLVCMLSICLLAGCGAEKTAESDEVVEISLSGYHPSEENEPEAYEAFMQQVAKFEELHPNVKIVNSGWNFDIQTYLTKAEAGTLPTIYNLPLTEAKKVIELGYAADLTEEFKERGMYDQITDVGLESISLDGKIYYVPGWNSYTSILVNMDLYKQAGFVNEDGSLYQPTDWEDLARVSKQIKDKTNVSGFVFPTIQNQGGWRTTPMAWSYGVDFMEKDESGKWKATFNTPEYVDMFKLIHKMKWEDNSLTATALIDYAKPMEMLAAGEVAMVFGDYDYANLIVTRYNMDTNNLGCLQLPAGPARHVTMMSGGFKVVDVNSTPAQVKVAMDWLEFTGMGPNLNEYTQAYIDSDMQTKLDKGVIIGLEYLSFWKDDAPINAYKKELSEKNRNIPLAQIEHMNRIDNIEFQEEEPVEGQALYSTIDSILQEVLNNKDADIEKLVSDAASDFQQNFLDYAE